MPKFIGKPAMVECLSGSAAPTTFKWDEASVRVVEVLAEWQDYGFGGAHPSARTWLTRRHRNYYRVMCDDGHVYEIYLDRGNGRREWHVYKQLD